MKRLEWLKVKHSKWPVDGQFYHHEKKYNFSTDTRASKNTKISPDVHFYGNKFTNAPQNNVNRNLTPVDANEK